MCHEQAEPAEPAKLTGAGGLCNWALKMNFHLLKLSRWIKGIISDFGC